MYVVIIVISVHILLESIGGTEGYTEGLDVWDSLRHHHDMEKNIAQFIGTTHASRSAAIRYLDKHGGDLEAAVDDFLTAEHEPRELHRPSGETSGKGSRQPGRSKGVIASLTDLHGRDEGYGGDDNDDVNDYYVGGEKSGQIVQGGPRDAAGRNRVEDVFDKAREAGAELGTTHQESGGPGLGGLKPFSGRGHTLSGITTGEETNENRDVETRVINIVFYENGVFVVDDGEPRRMDDPRNAAFMMAVMNGQCPPELLPDDPAMHVDIHLLRRQHDYEPPAEPKYRAFEGTGHTLRNETEPLVDETYDVGGSTSWRGPDETRPVTSIQIKLADGSRLVAKFNLDQTVGDIRTFLKVSRPDLGAFRLSTSFPTKELDNVNETIEEAGLAGSVVMQK